MPLDIDFVVEGNFSTDFTPLLEDARIVGGEFAKFAQNDKRFLIPAFAAEPTGGEGQENDTGA